MMPSSDNREDVIAAMEQTLKALKSRDSRAMHELNLDDSSEFIGIDLEDRRKTAIKL